MEKRHRPPAQDIGRILSGKMCPEDFIKLMHAVEIDLATFEKVNPEEAEDFVEACEKLGDQAYAYAAELEKNDNKETASEYYFNASALYRLGDYGIRGITDEKLRIYNKLLKSFRKSKKLTPYENCISVEIPFDGKTMPGYLLIPYNAPKDIPVIIYVAGATGFKEENYTAPYAIWERGCAALIFDGPGQGAALYNRQMYLTENNFDRAVKAVIEYIRINLELKGKLGIMGVSFGGYLATSAACYNKKELSALVCRGGASRTDHLTMRTFAGLENFYLYGFKEKFGIETLAEAAAISHKMNIEAEVHKIDFPVLVQHTEEDPVIGTEGARYIYNNVSTTDKEYYEIAGNVHCGNNEALKTMTYGVDWIIKKLKSGQ